MRISPAFTYRLSIAPFAQELLGHASGSGWIGCVAVIAGDPAVGVKCQKDRSLSRLSAEGLAEEDVSFERDHVAARDSSIHAHVAIRGMRLNCAFDFAKSLAATDHTTGNHV